METRRLGRTGHHSSVAILGGIVFNALGPDGSADGLQLALDAGVNHLDIAPSYGVAEANVGPHIPAVRDRLFIGCKTMEPTAAGLRRELERSLELLGCDSFDLYQLHAVRTVEEVDQRAEAWSELQKVRDEGLCRFIGVTGHDVGAPAAHAEAVRRYDLDTVMFPLYPKLWADPAYRTDAEALLALAAERDLGVQIIKAGCRRPWAKDAERWAATWYEPWTEDAGLERGIRFALSTPGVHGFCTPGDPAPWRVALEIAQRSTITSMSDEERAAAVDALAGEMALFPISAWAG